ncbi:MAG: hypothetical protein HQM11_02150 [SAR324 cluster bacterium]|nr:hypothetical protein [SAR324 cluster bacterium]
MTRWILLLILVTLSNPGYAYSPTWQDMVSWLKVENQITRAVMKTTVQVFDPFGKAVDEKGQHLDVEMESRGFKQTIYWKMDTHLAVETYSKDDVLLHFYYEEEGNSIDIPLSQDRIFTKEDVFPHYLRFLSNSPFVWGYGLSEMNITSRDIQMYRSQDNDVFYRIGDPDLEYFVLIDKDHWRLHSINSSIRSFRKTSDKLRIEFKSFTQSRSFTYPGVTEYFVNDRLFKRVTLVDFEKTYKLPLAQFYQKISNAPLLSGNPVNIDYSR